MIHTKGRPHLLLRWNEPGTRIIRQKTSGTANRREAEKLAAQLEADLNAGRVFAVSRVGWADFRERVEDERFAFLAEGTAGPIRSALNHVERLLRPKYLSDLTTQALSAAFAKLQDEGLKPATLSGFRAHLRSLLSWAASMHMLAVVPEIPKVRMPRGKTLMKGRPLSGVEFVRMLRAVPRERPKDSRLWRRFLIGLWRSGLRCGEALQLSWEPSAAISVDLTGRFPRLRITAAAEKGRRDRLLPIAPDFAAWLLRTPVAKRVGLVFGIVGRAGRRPMTVKRVSRIVAAIGRAAGVVANDQEQAFASAHDLRRSFGTRWSSLVQASELKLLMRHESIETTLRYYVAHEADDLSERLWKAAARS